MKTLAAPPRHEFGTLIAWKTLSEHLKGLNTSCIGSSHYPNRRPAAGVLFECLGLLRKGIWEIAMVSLSFAFWFVVLVHLLGIASVVVARLSENSAAQAGFQRLFYACLFTVGLAALAAIHAGDASRLFCATTLPIMAVGATIDLRRSGERPAS